MQQHFEQSRKNMVEGQIKPNKVTNEALIKALGQIPREQFLPANLQNLAYIDGSIDLGHGRFMPEPMLFARLVQEAHIQKTDTVLDIGCGTGYSSAVLGCMAKNVIGLERDKRMAIEASQHIKQLGIMNVDIIQQDQLHQGYAEKSPYDVILINGSVSSVPDKIKSQLAKGGRLVAVLAHNTYGGHIGSAMLVTRQHGGNALVARALFDTATPVLAGFDEPKEFVF